MTTITLKNNKEEIRTSFESWEELQEYALRQLVVRFYPVRENEISEGLNEKINKARKEFIEDPESFDDI